MVGPDQNRRNVSLPRAAADRRRYRGDEPVRGPVCRPSNICLCGAAQRFPSSTMLDHSSSRAVQPGRTTVSELSSSMIRRPPGRLGRQVASTHHVGPNPAVLGAEIALPRTRRLPPLDGREFQSGRRPRRIREPTGEGPQTGHLHVFLIRPVAVGLLVLSVEVLDQARKSGCVQVGAGEGDGQRVVLALVAGIRRQRGLAVCARVRWKPRAAHE